ncbi:MAG TPA: hypothetical protein VM802_04575 [Chitinophaga sp.]|uniref:hypothetical protein n=1 Tax=Chitinophaga sp. TaxID=1869181 RepID=UPI002B955741|nr:hypothetical protein [Chitinophaga sp.]HVI44114.1 hypothetical protein [Chitinophaga sp.]
MKIMLSKEVKLMLMFFLLVTSCQIKKKTDPEAIVQQWMGREIKFPSSIICSELGKVIPCKSNMDKKYRVLVYTDSSGCISCKLRLDEWKKFIRETDSSLVDFIFYFNPKETDNLPDLFKRENFRRQVYIDLHDEIGHINHFPGQMEYQCFLLDNHNKVLLIGNPTLSTKVWKLYQKTINERMDHQ